MKNDLLTSDDVCDYLGIARRTLDRWNARRIGPPQVRIGGLIRYRQKSLDEWLQQLEHEQPRAGGQAQ